LRDFGPFHGGYSAANERWRLYGFTLELIAHLLRGQLGAD
jgi:hypothetical protein